MKNVYFISDAHLGCLALKHRRQQERRLVRFLDEIKDKRTTNVVCFNLVNQNNTLVKDCANSDRILAKN